MSDDFHGVGGAAGCDAACSPTVETAQAEVQRIATWQALRADHAERALEHERRELGRARAQMCTDAAALAELRDQVAQLQAERAEWFRAAVTARRRLAELRPGDARFSFGRDAYVRHVALPSRDALVPVATVAAWPPVPIEGEE